MFQVYIAIYNQFYPLSRVITSIYSYMRCLKSASVITIKSRIVYTSDKCLQLCMVTLNVDRVILLYYTRQTFSADYVITILQNWFSELLLAK